MDPYRIKVVEEIPFTTREQRARALARAGHNLFNLPSSLVTIDLLTDSGTGALSDAQQAAAMLADESYAGSKSFARFREAVSDLTGFAHILPVHQGRAAEQVLFSTLLEPGSITVSNTHFDTTRANVEIAGGRALDLPCKLARDLDSPEPFKGDIDLEALADVLADPHRDVRLVILTITSNGLGGAPVSMACMRHTAALCHQHQVPLFLDAARFAENAWLVHRREVGYEHRTVRQIATEAFHLADGALISAKKDAISHTGGILAMRDGHLAHRCLPRLIATVGGRTYGGMAGRDMEMVAQGLREVTDPRYLQARCDATAALAERITRAGVEIIQPPGVHALYLRADRLLPHIPPAQLPGQTLACALYAEGGIRSCEIGSVFSGEFTPHGQLTAAAPAELVRLAIPRRTYTDSHLDYVADVVQSVAKQAGQLRGYRMIESPARLRHFTARFAPLHDTEREVE